jgi:peptidoglycan/LPS O-acetylase OafA/YrhL
MTGEANVAERSFPVARLGGIEGLRAVAAISVLVFHLSQVYVTMDHPLYGSLAFFLKPLQLGVTVFFVLSGFLLYRPFAAAILRTGEFPDVGRYVRSRALRILPLYWVVLLAVCLLFNVAALGAGSMAVGALRDPTVLLADGLLVQNYFPSTLWTGVGPAWSLAVEVVFYALLPLIGAAAFRLARRSNRLPSRIWFALAPVALLELIGVCGKAASVYVVPGPIGTFTSGAHSIIERGFLAQADGFAWGMLVAVLYIQVRDGRFRTPARLPRICCELAVIAGSGLLYVFAREMTTLAFPIPFALLLAVVVIPQASDRPRPRHLRLLETRPFVLAGLCSYSIFLWNQPVLFWMAKHGLVVGGLLGLARTLGLLLLITGVLSTVTYRLVEAPAMRLAHRPRPVRSHTTPVLEPATSPPTM